MGMLECAERAVRPRLVRILVVLGLALVALTALPAEARADDSYRMGPVDIEASVTDQGLLVVQEDRTFDFDGEFHGVYWDLATGAYQGQDVVVTVQSVGLVQSDGTYVPFEAAWNSQPHTYEVQDWEGTVRITLFNPVESETVTYRVVYMLQNVVQSWQDVGELYWKFVSDGWDEITYDITCTIYLPVPPGRSVVAGRDVRAWGHGTLDGEVTVAKDGSVVYKVPAVGTDQFAEARIAFPVGWLHTLPRNEQRLPTIIAEEQQWAEEANAQREQARAMTYGSTAGCVAVGAAAIGIAIWGGVSYRRRHRADFADPYWREAPSPDHPAIVGVLVNERDPGEEEFTATLMRLTDLKVLGLDLVKYRKKGVFGSKDAEDYRLTLHRDRALELEDPIDEGAVTFLFEDVAPKTATYRRIREEAEERAEASDARPDFDPVLALSEMRQVAKTHAGRYMDGLNEWKSTVKAAVERRGFYESGGTGMRVVLIVACVLSAIAAVVGFVFMCLTEPPWWFLFFLLIPIGGAIACGVVAASSHGYSDEADEIRARALALKRWLKDFTRLDEAIPTDVVLWNQLLVYAVVLGVADEVIEQLRVALPQVVDDPYFYPTYVWYVGYGGLGSPRSAFGDAFDSSYRASAAAVAASSDSSGSGSGGGFSGGGGGGFGGGGGGGAF